MICNSRYSSHDKFDHESIDSLGYDWERIANPGIKPMFPSKIYLPRETAHVVSAVKETTKLQQRLRIRSSGHSSNDLVLEDNGAVLCTEMLNKILHVDPVKRTVRIQSGVILSDLDEHLKEKEFNLGLPIIGDNNHITAGGFVSVGGISPASHRFGLFVDNVLEIEYVDWQGKVIRCSRRRNQKQFNKIRTGTGQHGVITELTCKLYEVDKFRTIVRNERKLYIDFKTFIAESEAHVNAPGDALYSRGLWVDLMRGGRNIKIGHYCRYYPAERTFDNQIQKELSFGYLQLLGQWAGRLPKRVDELVRLLGIIGIVLSPRYGSIKDIEILMDRVLDFSVGEPSRLLTVLAPVAAYREMFEAVYALCRDTRSASEAITGISIYVKPIKSDYLAKSNGSGHFVELTFLLLLDARLMTAKILDKLVSAIDKLCIKHGALRYMPTKTTKDPAVRRKVDPNYLYP